ncbi:hypothetical protein V8C86DRAFT_758161 [Haematococcus lacustris]
MGWAGLGWLGGTWSSCCKPSTAAAFSRCARKRQEGSGWGVCPTWGGPRMSYITNISNANMGPSVSPARARELGVQGVEVRLRTSCCGWGWVGCRPMGEAGGEWAQGGVGWFQARRSGRGRVWGQALGGTRYAKGGEPGGKGAAENPVLAWPLEHPPQRPSVLQSWPLSTLPRAWQLYMALAQVTHRLAVHVAPSKFQRGSCRAPGKLASLPPGLRYPTVHSARPSVQM